MDWNPDSGPEVISTLRSGSGRDLMGDGSVPEKPRVAIAGLADVVLEIARVLLALCI